MNNPAFIDKKIDPAFLLWLEENYPFYYECAMKKEYSKIPGSMYREYLEDLEKLAQNEVYTFGIE